MNYLLKKNRAKTTTSRLTQKQQLNQNQKAKECQN